MDTDYRDGGVDTPARNQALPRPDSLAAAPAAFSTAPQPEDLLLAWIHRQAPAPAWTWFQAALDEIGAGDDGQLLPAFVLLPRRLGRASLNLRPAERQLAQRSRRDWHPWMWRIDEAARARLLLALPLRSCSAYQATLETLFRDAGEREQVALLRALPLLPHGQQFLARAAEGVRSSSEAVLRAIALDNAYPRDHFSDQLWNRMVIKCLALGLPLGRVVGLTARMNADLVGLVIDLMQGQRAARGRPR